MRGRNCHDVARDCHVIIAARVAREIAKIVAAFGGWCRKGNACCRNLEIEILSVWGAHFVQRDKIASRPPYAAEANWHSTTRRHTGGLGDQYWCHGCWRRLRCRRGRRNRSRLRRGCRSRSWRRSGSWCRRRSWCRSWSGRWYRSNDCKNVASGCNVIVVTGRWVSRKITKVITTFRGRCVNGKRSVYRRPDATERHVLSVTIGRFVEADKIRSIDRPRR